MQPFLYPLKTSEVFFCCFQRVEKDALEKNGLIEERRCSIIFYLRFIARGF